MRTTINNGMVSWDSQCAKTLSIAASCHNKCQAITSCSSASPRSTSTPATQDIEDLANTLGPNWKLC